MFDLIKEYIGQGCIIYTMNSQLNGVISDVTDGWIKIDTETGTEAINLEYVVRVRQHPRNKKGKKRSIVVD